ncbi:MAG: UPF0175 family protein [Nitrospiraceae bacterium]|nr:UPF0175 family protein [Nitrospiraceae bacterium]
MGTKSEKIELDLPQDIIFAMKGTERPEEVKKKLKVALAILLFQEKSISLGKAVELAGMSRGRVTEVLKEHGLPAISCIRECFPIRHKSLRPFLAFSIIPKVPLFLPVVKLS